MVGPCKGCGATAEQEKFYVSNKSYCVECIKARVKTRRNDNIEEMRLYDRLRAWNPDRIKARQDYAKSHVAKSGDPSRKTEAARRMRAAHVAVGNAIARGALVRPARCEACEIETRVQAHHDDYAKPLEVRWFCTKCHVLHHIMARNLPGSLEARLDALVETGE